MQAPVTSPAGGPGDDIGDIASSARLVVNIVSIIMTVGTAAFVVMTSRFCPHLLWGDDSDGGEDGDENDKADLEQSGLEHATSDSEKV